MSEPLRIPSALPEGFQPTPPGGLTAEEVPRRKQNITAADPGKSVWQIIAGNLFTPFNLLNLALALCVALVGSWRNMLFMGVVISNTLIGTVQELRARATIRRLSLLNAPRTRVMRDGQEIILPSEELVEGDLVLIQSGDQVVADALVTGGVGAANEALLTGESDTVHKKPGDWLMSGSYITEGAFTAQLVHVGDDSYAARLTRSARAIKRPRSALMTEMGKLIRLVSYILLPLGVLLFIKEYFIMHTPLISAVPEAVAAMVGMIPEGLMLLTSVAMAVGVIKLGSRQALVQELYGIETLARADVLCLDKTGTLTTGRMIVKELLSVDAEEAALTAALARFLGGVAEHSATLDALRRHAPTVPETPLATLPFSSARKKSAVSFADGTTLILGAPEFVLSAGQLQPLKGQIARHTSQGSRVLALAEAAGCVTADDAPPVTRVLGLVILSDEIRPAAEKTLRFFHREKVRLVIISGDDPRTVSAISKRVGLHGKAVDASRLSDAELEEACERYTVFGRVTPVQKRLLVEALKRRGHSVAMTGDGVNDIPALKAADCSIAMSGGSDAAKHASQMTLLGTDFTALPMVMGEGRRVIGNITRASTLFLVKTLYSFALAALVLFLPLTYPFQPIQLTLVGSLTIGIPSFFLALEPNNTRAQGSFLRTVLLRAVPGAAAVTICAIASMVCRSFGWSEAACSTLATLSAGTVGILMLLNVCRPLTKLRALLVAAMTVGFVGAVLLLGHIFLLTRLTLPQLLALFALILLAILVMGSTMLLMKRWQTRPVRSA